MSELVELVVGQCLPLNDIPDDDTLVYVFLKEDINQLVESLGLPPGMYSAALVKVKAADYQTVWLSKEHRSFDLNASYVLAKHGDQIMSLY